MNSVSRRFVVAALSLMALGLASAVHPQSNPPADISATLFQNVRIFDGKGGSLSAPSNVLVKGNIIERISTAPIAAEPGVTVIAGQRANADARPDRRTLACDADTAQSCSGDHR